MSYNMKGMGKLIQLYGGALEDTEKEYNEASKKYKKAKQNKKNTEIQKSKVDMLSSKSRLGEIVSSLKDTVGKAMEDLGVKSNLTKKERDFEKFLEMLKHNPEFMEAVRKSDIPKSSNTSNSLFDFSSEVSSV